MRFARVGTGLAILIVSVLLGAGAALRWLAPPPAPPAWDDEYDITAVEPELIAPGTVVDRAAPSGWSHLIIKAQPRVKPSEVAKVPVPPFADRARVVRQVAWMFTVFAADVVKEQQGSHTRYRLRAVGFGLGTAVDGRDTVMTVETAKQFGVNLDIIQAETLKTGYVVQKRAKVVVHGPSFAIVDTPVTFVCDGRNRMVRFRYALLVDAQTGQLDVFCWQSGGEDGQCADLTRAVLLNPNTIDDAELIPDLKEFNALNIPSELGFGVDGLPPHRLEVTMPVRLRDLAGKTRFTPEDARTLEEGLRKLLP
jgi:hypothetical protein